MKYKKIIALLFITALVISLPSRYAVAKDEEFEDWLNESYNPVVSNVVKDLNKTIKENWYFNLSDFLIKGDNDTTVERLELLRKDIKDLKKDLKAIKLPEFAEKKDKKSVKYTKKQLNKDIKSIDKDSKKLIKKINKEKDITSIAERQATKKGIAKANDEYMALNKKLGIKVTKFKLNNFIKIDESIAKSYINKQEKEKKK